MEPVEGPTDCFNESQGYSSLSHPAVFKKPKVSPSFEMAEKSDVLLQRKGHAMKDRIALLGIVISACQFSPSYLARASADHRQRSRIESRSSHRGPPHAAVGHEGDGNEQEQWAFGGRDHQRSRSLRAGADYRSVACGSSRSRVLGANARYGQRRIGPHASLSSNLRTVELLNLEIPRHCC